MNEKFELTSETKELFGLTLYRIKALTSFADVEEGALGGFVAKEENLSTYGNAWVYDNATVSGNAKVSGDDKVYDNATVKDKTRVNGDVKV